MTRFNLLCVTILVLALPFGAQADPVADILSEAEADCAGFENGRFDAGDAVTEADLDGDGMNDRLVDTARFTCTSAASLYCGSGGCSLIAVVGSESWDFQVEGWRLDEWNSIPILVLARDGGWCGASGAETCFEAIRWSQGRMLTVGPQP